MIWSSIFYCIFAFLHCIFAIKKNGDFLINDSECNMPNFAAFSEETYPIFQCLPYVNCSNSDILTYTTVQNNTAYLHIRNEYLNQYYSPQDRIDCCYSYVKRNGSSERPDVGISISTCTNFNSTTPLEEDTVLVNCYLGGNNIYQNTHATITVTETLDAKIKKLKEKSKALNKKPISVLMIVIDGVSRLNFKRTMPESREFLAENKFIEFMGYNKIDDNTFPNFNALLTGLNLSQSINICKPTMVGELDKCPMIWYDFRNYGYATAYAEDWARLSTYVYLKKGFKNPPTDYYFKPYMEASDTLGETYVDTMPFCTGPESQGERTLNIARDFAVTFKNQPSFGIFWMNTFSHNKMNTPTRMDFKFKAFLEDLKSNDIFNNSIVVLLADHGVRFGEIEETIQGWYEERLPVNFISLPPWFIQENPTKYNNLKLNSKRLTSTYDLYMTLQDVLSLSVENYTIKTSQACPDCKSLFLEIPDNRSCSKAGIPEFWCTCIGKFESNHTDLTPEINEAAIKFIESDILDSDRFKAIVSSSITYHQEMAYFLIKFTTEHRWLYQVTIKATKNPLKFIKVLGYKIIFIY